MNRIFLCAAVLFLAIPAVAQTDCVGQVEKPIYPPLARQARLEGEVKAHFDVGSDGKPINLALEGHPLLKQAVESAINKTSLDMSWTGSVDLIYRFAIDNETSYEAHQTIRLQPAE